MMNVSQFTNFKSNRLKALYWANTDNFSLSSPLKFYHGYLIDKITQTKSSTLKILVWRITHVVTGVFAYPILGILAGMDIMINSLKWRLQDKKHNQEVEASLDLLFNNLPNEKAEGFSLPIKVINGQKKIPHLICVKKYEGCFYNSDKEELKKQIENDIKEFSTLYTKCYMQYSGKWNSKNSGESTSKMTIEILAQDSTNAYCSNPFFKTIKNFKNDQKH